jgi:hypothetical protein
MYAVYPHTEHYNEKAPGGQAGRSGKNHLRENCNHARPYGRKASFAAAHAAKASCRGKKGRIIKAF